MSLNTATVRSAMTKEVRTVAASAPVHECVAAMELGKVGCVVVTDGEKPVGIFTESDLVRLVAQKPRFLELRMDEAMSKPIVTVLPTATVWDAMSLMGRKGIRRLPVLEEGRLVGIITEKDVFRVILSQEDLLLEAISEFIPTVSRTQLREVLSHFGIQAPSRP
jgi:CBS domain-containing protein